MSNIARVNRDLRITYFLSFYRSTTESSQLIMPLDPSLKAMRVEHSSGSPDYIFYGSITESSQLIMPLDPLLKALRVELITVGRGWPWPAVYIIFVQIIHQINGFVRTFMPCLGYFYALPNNERGTKYRGLTYSARQNCP